MFHSLIRISRAYNKSLLIGPPPNHLAYMATCGLVPRTSCIGEDTGLKASTQTESCPIFEKKLPLHFGIKQAAQAQYNICKIYAQPQKGFYLCFSFLRKEKCIEIHFIPQKSVFRRNHNKSNQTTSDDDETAESHEMQVQSVEGQTMFDGRYSIYKRLHIDAIGEIIAVFEKRKLVHENFAFSGERRVGFRRTRGHSCKLYICGNQFRLPGCPRIEATFTFTEEDMAMLWRFFDSSLTKCLMPIHNEKNSSLHFTE